MINSPPRLYVVATPLGNLEDMTFRAVATLREVSLILCEDKRISSKLLHYYDVKTPLQTYNAVTERRMEEIAFDKLFKEHLSIALITDAGTPSISDPGTKLVNHCHHQGISVIPIPGPSALATALSVCGISAKESLFYGFLPNRKGRRLNLLKALLDREKRPIVFYESPYRFLHFLECLVELNFQGGICICRELTKQFEEIRRDTPIALLNYFREKGVVKGEFVIVVDNS